MEDNILGQCKWGKNTLQIILKECPLLASLLDQFDHHGASFWLNVGWKLDLVQTLPRVDLVSISPLLPGPLFLRGVRESGRRKEKCWEGQVLIQQHTPFSAIAPALRELCVFSA
ncbi:hypothetical protein AOLI_G00161390 [Acnodon oligacanthus]